MPNWEFASTGGGSEEGINNTLTEHFEGNYNYYLAREIIQNSLDARDSQEHPVKVVFKLESYNVAEFPGKDRFVEILRLCNRTHHDDLKTTKFFTKAESLFNDRTIPGLKISDYNTVGLYGSDGDRDSPWFALVKSRGVSQKKEGSGGSYGLGKGAVFAASHLRTAFYSTTCKKDARSRFLGVSMLVNYDENGDTKQSIGSYGEARQSTIFEPRKMNDYWRKEKGLDIHIMGYKYGNNWDDELLKSVLRNFWYAILQEDLIVEVGEKVVDFVNLEGLLTHYFFNEPLKDYEEPKGNPLLYYQAVMKGKQFEMKLPNLGEVSFYYEQLDEQLNYVAMLRKSHMVIYTRLFHHAAPYAGVFICDDDQGNELLRKMEPPAHDKWDPDREKEDGRKIMEELTQWIRSCLKEMRKMRSQQISEIPGTAKYLPLDEEDSNLERQGMGNDSKGESEADETKREFGKAEVFEGNAIIEPYRVSIINEEQAGMHGKSKAKRSGTRKRKNNTPAPRGGTGNARALNTKEFNARIYSTSLDFDRQEYIAKILGEYDGKCNIKLTALGDVGGEKIKIMEIHDPRGLKCKISNNCIYGFHLNKNEEIRVRIILKEKIKVSLKIEAYEI